MSITKSSPQELRRARALVRLVKYKIRKLIANGKQVHIVWDIDSVLCSGRSDDAFSLLGFDVARYFIYEERLLAKMLEPGPWASLAGECGILHSSQDIVTARSSFLALRVMYFLLMRRIPVRWQLFVGHQSKAESYRIILKSFEKNPDTHIFCVDDGKKHIDAFINVAEELGMKERCYGIISPQIREYGEDELKHEVGAVMAASGGQPVFARTYDTETGSIKQMVPIVPVPHAYLREVFFNGSMTAQQKATVEELRPQLEAFADEVMPGKPKTDADLFMLFEMIRSPH
ncbi:hypothetical protein HYT45_03515 [Candidatus Uhrbacteria bacterium]|nr:hypothetical protein [Candidatus Uhrbacteria bacterium]